MSVLSLVTSRIAYFSAKRVMPTKACMSTRSKRFNSAPISKRVPDAESLRNTRRRSLTSRGAVMIIQAGQYHEGHLVISRQVVLEARGGGVILD